MDIKDLAGLSAPLTKLVDVLSSGFGTIYRPTGIRREASAQSEATLMIGAAQLEVDVNRARALAEVDASNKLVLNDASVRIEQRVQARLDYREKHKQNNLEAIANSAALHLPEEVSTTAVDEDWKARFFNIAEDVSSDQMQDLWGKILAGEVTQPGTYSVRTLEALRNISQAEAEVFQKLRYLALNDGCVLKLNEVNDEPLMEYGLLFRDILLLREAGLLADGDMLSLKVPVPPKHGFVVLGFNGQGILLEPKNSETTTLTFEVLALTRVGVQLMSLIDPVPNVDYLRKFALEKKDTLDIYFGIPGEARETFEKLT